MNKNKITCLTDYKNRFGSKWNSVPYRSGIDKELLKNYFAEKGYSLIFKNFKEIDFESNEINENLFLYTSSEDWGNHYKNYIEDIVLGIQNSGGIVIPEYKFLRAHNNKIFMEILKSTYLRSESNLKSNFYGSLEEVNLDGLKYPIVFKSSQGSMSQGVALAQNKNDLEKVIKSKCKVKNVKEDVKDTIRRVRRTGYIKESLYRKKFILQEFVPNLDRDYKLLFLGESCFIFERPVRKNDFRASGSGNKNYIYGSNVKYPSGIFDYGFDIFKKFNVPNISLDIAFDGKTFYLIEFQALYFGSVGFHKSKDFFTKKDSTWIMQANITDFEKAYVDSIIYYIKNNNL